MELIEMGKAPVKRKRTTNSQHDFQRYPNRVMNLEVERPDEVWVGEITYIRLQNGVKTSMAEVGQAWQNGYAERLMRTIKEEEVDLSEYQNFTEAYQ